MCVCLCVHQLCCINYGMCVCLGFLGGLQELCVHVSHHPCQLGVPAVLQDREPVVGGALRAEGLQTRRRQCCQGFLSAPLVQPLGELLRRHRERHTYIQWRYEFLTWPLYTETKQTLNNMVFYFLQLVCNTWGLVLAQAKSGDDILADLVLVF